MTDLELADKWCRKVIEWKHPYRSTRSIGRVVSVKNGFLIVRDAISTEGIREDWVTYTYK